MDLGNHVEKVELAFEFHRFGLVYTGQAIDTEISLDETSNGREEVSGPIAEIRT
jgi:hypothetical protein